MKRGLALAALCGALMLGSVASAKDLKGKLGVGSDATLSGLGGVSARYGVENNVSVQAVVAAGMYSPSDGDSETELLLGLGGIYDVINSEDLAVGLRLGVDIGFFDPTDADSGTQLSFTGGLRPELFLNSSFSLHAQLGMSIDLVPATGRVLAQNDAVEGARNEGTTIALNVDLLGTAGFTFWF
jgi:hypothetical protein